MAMNHRIFISLTAQDKPIADALKRALQRLIGDSLDVKFSPGLAVGDGPSHGQDWFEWIVDQVEHCDFAFIVLSPASIQKPWILWESGAVQGAAGASGQREQRKVRPILFQVTESELPSPIRESKVQFRRGDRPDHVENLFKEVINEYRNDISIERIGAAFGDLGKVTQEFIDTVAAALLRAPGVPTSVAVEEWLSRLDALLKENRKSEVVHLQDWMEIAFGREAQSERRPLDLRVHTRLGEVYLATRNYPRAVQQLELARQLAPRDIYVLRSLGRAYLETQNYDGAQAAIDRITELDGDALTTSPECAALDARYLRERKRLPEAIAVLGDALAANPDSYYLANLHGEYSLEAGNREQAKASFGVARKIIERLREPNIWTNATAANAAFVVGDDDGAEKLLRAVMAKNPDADELATIERGLRRLAPLLEQGDHRMARFAAVLHPQAEQASPAMSARAGV